MCLSFPQQGYVDILTHANFLPSGTHYRYWLAVPQYTLTITQEIRDRILPFAHSMHFDGTSSTYRLALILRI